MQYYLIPTHCCGKTSVVYTIDDIMWVTHYSSRSTIFRILDKYNVELNRGRMKGPRRKKGTEEAE